VHACRRYSGRSGGISSIARATAWHNARKRSRTCATSPGGLERDGRPLETIGRAYAAQFPELEITVPEFSDHRGSIRGSAPTYLLGDFYQDGAVSIERMELTQAQFERVIRALRDEE
jgi:hypothetical protein